MVPKVILGNECFSPPWNNKVDSIKCDKWNVNYSFNKVLVNPFVHS